MMDSNTLISIRNTESATDNDIMRAPVQNTAYNSLSVFLYSRSEAGDELLANAGKRYAHRCLSLILRFP